MKPIEAAGMLLFFAGGLVAIGFVQGWDKALDGAGGTGAWVIGGLLAGLAAGLGFAGLVVAWQSVVRGRRGRTARRKRRAKGDRRA